MTENKNIWLNSQERFDLEVKRFSHCSTDKLIKWVRKGFMRDMMLDAALSVLSERVLPEDVFLT